MKVYGRKATDPERLRLLEAVAVAMKEAIAAYEMEWTDYHDAVANQRLLEAMEAGKKALAALKAYDG